MEAKMLSTLIIRGIFGNEKIICDPDDFDHDFPNRCLREEN